MRSPVATWRRLSPDRGGGAQAGAGRRPGQKREPVWNAPVLDYSSVDYPGYVDDVDRDALMGWFRAHHRALVGAARYAPDPCGPVDRGRVLNGEGQVREPAAKVQDCGLHIRDRLGTAALDAVLVLHEVRCQQLIDDGEVAGAEGFVYQPDQHVDIVWVL